MTQTRILYIGTEFAATILHAPIPVIVAILALRTASDVLSQRTAFPSHQIASANLGFGVSACKIHNSRRRHHLQFLTNK